MAGSSPNKIDQYQGGSRKQVSTDVIVESAVSLTVNGQLWLTFRCTPIDLEALAVGFLFNEGIISQKVEIASVHVCDREENIDVWINHRAEKPKIWQRTSGCTGGMTSQESIGSRSILESLSKEVVTPMQVHSLVSMLIQAQQLYRQAGGVHTSVLSDGLKVVASSEDIGRHNTLDKIAGMCLLQDLHPEQRMLLTTGRISSEMIQKTARIGASLIISRTSPSSLSVQLAQQMGILLVGYARSNRFNVYTHPERVIEDYRSKTDLPVLQVLLSSSDEVL